MLMAENVRNSGDVAIGICQNLIPHYGVSTLAVCGYVITLADVKDGKGCPKCGNNIKEMFLPTKKSTVFGLGVSDVR